ncbi:hypothetical protein TW78_08835 [Vibrio coralliilyticus]|uniref:Uncharacterized protein n=1 Tax=Vibrio coralliilyticus TaxID=190893 RepID=A0A837G9W3_9VIBR|nr:hypothetical protein [Vibrio coralliilyticus]KJY74129.1 hypothetical protein TW78_08835 [Vibrio coralliilyticus]QOU29874.1 hypothetical protein TW71_015105 [Vibrio coralliilyticus]
MSSYYDWEDFADIYLEDSFVLRICESYNEISFIVEAVLTENHPLYRSPESGEQYCYKKGKIVFQGLKCVKWISKNETPFKDVSGEEDYGNIDTFQLLNDQYRLSGDWGELEVRSSSVKWIWIEM